MRRLGVALLLIASACSRCGGRDVARLAEAEATVERGRDAAPGQWAAARAGDRFRTGEMVRTGAQSRARLELDGGGLLRLGANTLVRFGASRAPSAQYRVGVETGSAEIEGGEGGSTIDTMFGLARLEKGARARIAQEKQGARLEVLVGRARLEEEGGKEVALGDGQALVFSLGAAKAERVPASPVRDMAVAPPGRAVDASVAPPDASVVDAAKARAAEVVAPTRADLSIPVGESPVIHDPEPPTAVRVAAGDRCAGEVELELGKAGRLVSVGRGTGSVIALVGAGGHRYQLRCVATGEVAGSGVLRVLRDAGVATLPRTAPLNVLEADGRGYSVLYQNRLPAFTFRWPKAPAAKGYVFRIEGPGKPRTATGSSPSQTLQSGDVGEGKHRFWFEAEGGGRSPETRLTVDFDNAAPAAHIKEPVDRTAWPAGELRVAGVAIVGATASVGGTPLEFDSHQRFAASVPRPASDVALAIRISHPEHGMHYYLRRPARP